MPLKWRIYYWCAIYYLVWNAFTILYVLYHLASGNEGIGNYIVLIVSCIMLAKPFFCIKFINHYKRKTNYEDDEVFLFVMFFVLNIIYAALAVIAFTYAFTSIDNSLNFSPANISLETGVILFVAVSVYFIIFDFPLKFEVAKQRNTDIGKEIKNNP